MALIKAGAGHTGRLMCAAAGCGAEAVDTDERVNRSQLSGAAVDVDLFQPLCRSHHDWKHMNPNAAEAAGLYERGATYRRRNQ